ncbi:hypothetical protein [Paracraurococcus lichenis]|uniref:Glycosyltransferase RgtA/B/C/D-like domain-containing protein n=1 Tax=Paracraurococcus lichenis TaxID=3064888 RepID=A0ABT9E1B6_9PROT|nr:hypothetical protein [Paracraurococcus sp. LOR1-02]MDO9709938.1 hypothetical protein [Paracraurococcus sp. LOR1-02]
MLLAACAAYGQWITAGVSLPPDLDSFRDIAVMQGLLDGNWFGDPTTPGTPRYYPPLVPVLYGATQFVFGGTDLVGFSARAAPWLNLISPVLFFLMARRLLDSLPAASAALAVFVLLNGVRGAYWLFGGYTPWPAAPMLALALFFAAVMLLRARVAAGRIGDAALVGAAAGLVGLAHLVPALLLSAIILAAAATAQGPRLRMLAWVAVAGAAECLVMAPYLLPPLATDGVLNRAGGAWTDPALTLRAGAVAKLALQHAPGLAAVTTLWWLRRDVQLSRVSAAIIATWIGVPLLFLLRHYACAALPLGGPAACRVFVVPAHHPQPAGCSWCPPTIGTFTFTRVGPALSAWRSGKSRAAGLRSRARDRLSGAVSRQARQQPSRSELAAPAWRPGHSIGRCGTGACCRRSRRSWMSWPIAGSWRTPVRTRSSPRRTGIGRSFVPTRTA